MRKLDGTAEIVLSGIRVVLITVFDRNFHTVYIDMIAGGAGDANRMLCIRIEFKRVLFPDGKLVFAFLGCFL